ncbi:hypothetical protein ALC53_01571, partial [Atta colombica]
SLVISDLSRHGKKWLYRLLAATLSRARTLLENPVEPDDSVDWRLGGIIQERTTMSSVRRRFSPAEIKGKANLDKKPLANSKRVETTRGMKKSNGSSSNGGSDGGGRGMTILRPLCRLRNHAKVYRRSLGRSSQGLPPREDKKGWSFVCRDS